jgi:integrase
MAGKQAKILSAADVSATLRRVARRRHAVRDRVTVLLSVKAGLRAVEIAKLTWPMAMTQRYIEGDTLAKRRLIGLL